MILRRFEVDNAYDDRKDNLQMIFNLDDWNRFIEEK